MSLNTVATEGQGPEDLQRLFSPSRNLEEFSGHLVPHRVFIECQRDILRRVARPGVSNILSVVGPSGVGKTQLLNEIGGELLRTPAVGRSGLFSAELSVGERPYLPVVVVTANSGRTFESRFKNLLKEILKQVNNVATKMGAVRSDNSPAKRPPWVSLQQLSIARLEELVRTGLKERQVRAVLIDKGQHLAQSADAKDWQLVGDGLKLLGSISGTLIILFGTSELLSLPSLSGQLGRRTKVVPFRRYTWNDPMYPGEFERVVAAFANNWANALPANLLFKHLPYIYTGCVGCVGTLSGWLYDAMALAEQEGLPAVTLEILERTAHSEAKLRQWDVEARKCEASFEAEHTKLDKLVAELCPSSGRRAMRQAITEAVRPVPYKKKSKPGNRKPVYDPYPAAA